MFGTHPDRHLIPLLQRAAGHPQVGEGSPTMRASPPATSCTRAGKKFIAGEPMKPATKQVGRPVVEVERLADLLDAARVHHHDAVGERHRLDLVVGDIDDRRAEQLVQLGDLDARRDAQRRVEVGQRLVEQEHVGLAHDRAADGDALALAAGEVAGIAVEQLVEPQHARRLGDPPLALGRRDAGELQAEGHVLAHVHVRVERVGLEHHRDLALGGGERVDESAADVDVAGGDAVEPGDHAQQRRLAAARRSDQHDEFAVVDGKVDVAEHARGAVALVQLVDAQVRHVDDDPI